MALFHTNYDDFPVHSENNVFSIFHDLPKKKKNSFSRGESVYFTSASWVNITHKMQR